MHRTGASLGNLELAFTAAPGTHGVSWPLRDTTRWMGLGVQLPKVKPIARKHVKISLNLLKGVSRTPRAAVGGRKGEHPELSSSMPAFPLLGCRGNLVSVMGVGIFHKV